jgi:hypothetical protein
MTGKEGGEERIQKQKSTGGNDRTESLRSENQESTMFNRHEELVFLPVKVTSGLAVGSALTQHTSANHARAKTKRRADTAFESSLGHCFRLLQACSNADH